ncbi:MAG: hypothetical protein SH809_18090 [Rhodothermales bacterium]|nr:hypothetical protein [Rhodothermales bacterium]
MSDYSVDVNVPHPVTSRVEVGNKDGQPFTSASTVEVFNRDGLPYKTDSTIRVPDPIKTESTISIPEPIKTESTISIPEPIKTESTAEIDVKPVALDQCLRIRLDPVPTTCIHQPYQQHIGFSVFGVEVFGIDVQGEARSIIEGMDRKPHVLPAGPRPAPETSRHDGPRIRLDR